jgi:hypothetical protein
MICQYFFCLLLNLCRNQKHNLGKPRNLWSYFLSFNSLIFFTSLFVFFCSYFRSFKVIFLFYMSFSLPPTKYLKQQYYKSSIWFLSLVTCCLDTFSSFVFVKDLSHPLLSGTSHFDNPWTTLLIKSGIFFLSYFS